jgi:hypothetical protein
MGTNDLIERNGEGGGDGKLAPKFATAMSKVKKISVKAA